LTIDYYLFASILLLISVGAFRILSTVFMAIFYVRKAYPEWWADHYMHIITGVSGPGIFGGEPPVLMIGNINDKHLSNLNSQYFRRIKQLIIIVIMCFLLVILYAICINFILT